jgi:hypothetical protein
MEWHEIVQTSKNYVTPKPFQLDNYYTPKHHSSDFKAQMSRTTYESAQFLHQVQVRDDDQGYEKFQW